MISTKGTITRYLVKLTPLPERMTVLLEHIDLAHPQLTRKEMGKAVVLENLDLVGTIAKVQEFINIKNGKQKLVDRAFLKWLGPCGNEFILFPNLPLELRQKIIGMAMYGRNVDISIVDNGTGQWTGRLPRTNRSCKYGFESAMIASKEGFQYLSTVFAYQQVFKNGATVHSAMIDDFASLTLTAGVQQPSLTIGHMFSAKFDLANIQSITFKLNHLNVTSANWIYINIVGLPNLKFLRILGSIPITAPLQQETAFHVTGEDMTGNRKCYTHELHIKNDSGSVKFEDDAIMGELGRLIVNGSELQAMIGVWTMLERCLRNKTRFPRFPAYFVMHCRWIADQHA
jgi:hypothetical protein